MTIGEILEPYGVGEKDFAAALAEDLCSKPQGGSSGLTAEQEEVLVEHGGLEPAEHDDTRGVAVLSARTSLAEQIRTSMSVEEAGRLIGIDPSRVRHRVRDGSLYGHKVGKSLRLPYWQFADESPLPSLRSVLVALPADLHPLEATAFMTTPVADLALQGHDRSPVDWLTLGGDARTVTELAAAIDTW